MPIEIRRMVVGVAPGREADPVLPLAVELARALGCVMEAVQVFPYGDPALDVFTHRGMTSPAARQRHADTLRAALRERLAELDAPAGSEAYALAGHPSATLAGIARMSHADLVVIGPTRRGAVARRVLGTTATHVVRDSPLPVLVLAKPLPGSTRRVLMGNDLTDFGAEVHRRGLSLLKAMLPGAHPIVRSLFVVTLDEMLASSARPEPADEAAVREVEDFLRGQVPPGMEVLPAVRFGSPADELLAEARAWPADLVVLGTHRRKGLPRLVLGSVAGAVLRRAECNALVVPVHPDTVPHPHGRPGQFAALEAFVHSVESPDDAPTSTSPAAAVRDARPVHT
jgi:nucleotide-binding universal stress UspA family protein